MPHLCEKTLPITTPLHNLPCHSPVVTSGQMPRENSLQASSDLNLPVAQGELAQMVERSLSMREVAGSMPAFSKEPTIFALLMGGA